MAIVEYDLNKYFNYSNVYYGDIDGFKVFAIKSSDNSNESYFQTTKELEFGYNIKCKITSVDGIIDGKYHILKCKNDNSVHLRYFIRMFDSFLCNEDYSKSDNINDLFSSYLGLFSRPENRSLENVEGFFCELYFMYYVYESGCNIYDKWQKKEKMPFDFTFSLSKRLDVKSTLKNNRIHHFNHEQLTCDLYDIKVASFKAKISDEGVSLNGLIDMIHKQVDVLPLHTEKMIHNYISNTSNSEILENLKFDLIYLKNNLHIVDAVQIPKFNCKQPNGVSNAEYDSDLNMAPDIGINGLIEWINS